KVGGFEGVPVFATIGMDDPYGYRNKGQIPVREINGELATGFYEKRRHNLIPIEDFAIKNPKIDETVVIVRDILRKYNVKAYDEDKHEGDIRHNVVRRRHIKGEIMNIVVPRTFMLPHVPNIVTHSL